jgi:putative membrane protein
MFKIHRHQERNLAKGLVAGVVGGLAASWVMSNFQTFWSEVSSAIQEQKKKQQAQQAAAHKDSQESGQRDEESEGGGEQQEPATLKAAEALSHSLRRRDLTQKEKQIAGPLMHYAMGTLTGAMYGVVREAEPELPAGEGLLFGGTVWMVADNIAVPALGLSKPPIQYPISTHMYALASHLVYGFTAELVRRIVRKAL